LSKQTVHIGCSKTNKSTISSIVATARYDFVELKCKSRITKSYLVFNSAC